MQTIDTGTGWIEPEYDFISGERRTKPRFELHLPLRYRVLGSKGDTQGAGLTRDMSSRGVAFKAEGEIGLGAKVELTIQWPIPLAGSVPLMLIILGHVVRSGDGLIAVRVRRSHFRTQSRARASGGFFSP